MMQRNDHPRKHFGGHKPGYDGKSNYLSYEHQYVDCVYRVLCSSGIEMLADGKSDYE